MQERSRPPDKQQSAQFLLAQLKRRVKAFDEVSAELTQFLTHLKVEELALLSLDEVADFAEATPQTQEKEEEAMAARLAANHGQEDSLTRSCMELLFNGSEMDFDLDQNPLELEEEEKNEEGEFDALSFVASVINP